MEWAVSGYLISTDTDRLQIDRIHRFLSEEAYWSKGIPKDVVANAVKSSLCFGLFDEKSEQQIGFARIVTDRATFAWFCDVYVEYEYRGRGLSKWLMECALSHPDLKGLRRICLATRDAHELYKKFGFEVTKSPQNWMEIKDNDIYAKLVQPTC